MIALALSHLKYVGWLVCLVLAFALWHEHDARIRDTAVADAHLAALTRTEGLLRDSIAKARGTVIRDTVRITPALAHWHHARDTATVHCCDSVLVTTAFAAADTTIERYHIALTDTGLLNRLLTSQVAVKDSEVVTLTHLIPTRMQRVRNAVTWGAIGAASVLLLHGVGVIR